MTSLMTDVWLSVGIIVGILLVENVVCPRPIIAILLGEHYFETSLSCSAVDVDAVIPTWLQKQPRMIIRRNILPIFHL